MSGIRNICIIGAGAAGLAAIRHVNASDKLIGVVFESSNDIGGIWNYTDQIGKDENGYLVHPTIYKGLRTNLPKEIMGFLDFDFTKGDHSFTYHWEVLDFLKDYANHFKLWDSIKFNTRVVKLIPIEENCIDSLERWEITTERINPMTMEKEIMIEDFDAVMICSGHYCKPKIPMIRNLENFRGEVLHSRDYRCPEQFRDKKILVLGSGPSAIDVILEVASVAQKISLSMRNPPHPGKLPGKIDQIVPISEARNHSMVLENGEELECDVLLLCTGYEYYYPYLTPECGLEILEGKLIKPLFRHMINVNFPTMALIGIPFRICPFILFDAQTRHFVKYLEGNVTLPSKEEMLKEIKDDEDWRSKKSIPLSRSHELENSQWNYYEKLAKEASFRHLLKPFVLKVYDKVALRRKGMPDIYKNDQIRIVDDENFVIIEAT